MQKKNISYNQAIGELEIILSDIEGAELDVDELISKLKRASDLVKYCKKKLHTTEEELNKIMIDLEER